MKNEDDNRSFTSWMKDHKNELLIGGVSLALIAIGFGIWRKSSEIKVSVSIPCPPQINPKDFSRNVLIPKMNAPDNVVAEVSDPVCKSKVAHYVSSHVRTLKEGWSASTQKIATASEHGYTLLSNQTWVEAYNTQGVAQ